MTVTSLGGVIGGVAAPTGAAAMGGLVLGLLAVAALAIVLVAGGGSRS